VYLDYRYLYSDSNTERYATVRTRAKLHTSCGTFPVGIVRFARTFHHGCVRGATKNANGQPMRSERSIGLPVCHGHMWLLLDRTVGLFIIENAPLVLDCRSLVQYEIGLPRVGVLDGCRSSGHISWLSSIDLSITTVSLFVLPDHPSKDSTGSSSSASRFKIPRIGDDLCVFYAAGSVATDGHCQFPGGCHYGLGGHCSRP